MKKFLILIIFCGILVPACAQRVLVLENHILGRSYKYHVGQHIRLSLAGEKKKTSGRITEIHDSGIVVSNYKYVEFKTVTAVHRERVLVSVLSKALAGVGLLYFVLDVVNSAANKDKPLIRNDVAIVSGSLVAAGAALVLLQERRCPIARDQWKLKSVEEIRFKP